MELTKEYFDSKLAGLATKADLETFATKHYIDERIDDLARMTQHGFEDIIKRLDVMDVRQEVAELKAQMREVRQELNLA